MARLESRVTSNSYTIEAMGKFGQAAVFATACVTSKGLSPRDAWDFAIAQLSASLSMQMKSCPRIAYLSLCEAGAVVGIKTGKYGTRSNNKNGRYALNAYRILRSNPNQPVDEAALWVQATAPDVIEPNHQMEVVLSLWKHALLH